jgi:ABC-type branched-subunit amino acid transport system permease subunit
VFVKPVKGINNVPAALGVVTGAIILRTTGLTLLMQTLVIATLLLELANKAGRWTGGADLSALGSDRTC